MTERNKSDLKKIESLLSDSRADQPEVPPALFRRVLADADSMQQKPAATARKSGKLRQWIDAINWPVFGGLAAASCAGVLLGIYPPEGMINPVDFLLMPTVDYVETAEFSGFGWDLQEE